MDSTCSLSQKLEGREKNVYGAWSSYIKDQQSNNLDWLTLLLIYINHRPADILTYFLDLLLKLMDLFTDCPTNLH